MPEPDRAGSKPHPAGDPARRAPVRVLARAFFDQLFTGTAVTSDIRLRETMIWVLAFLAMPGLFGMLHVAFGWEIAVRQGRPALIELLLAQLAALFVTHSIVSTGFLAVLIWDGLTFEKDDAMVLGPLPIRGPAVVWAKLGALAAYLIGTAAVVNLASALPFAVVTGGAPGTGVLRHLAAHLAATLGGAVFVFASIVAVRGGLALALGARLAAATGSLLQFVFVGVLLWFLVAIPDAMSRESSWLATMLATPWLPAAWFVGLFEAVRGSERPEAGPLAVRAIAAVVLSAAGAMAVTAAGFRAQMHRALAPASPARAFTPVRATAWLARALAGRDQAARGTAAFVVLTIARNRAQQTPIAINAAVGLAMAVGALSLKADGLASLATPRTVVLWMPLVMTYWIAIGMRAACFVPADARASWAFRAADMPQARACRRAVRAAMLAYILPRSLLLSLAILVPLLGWAHAASHTVLVLGVTALGVELLSWSVPFVPFTRLYEPGHAKLKSRWPLYLLGLYLFAYWPARYSMLVAVEPRAVLLAAAAAALAAATLAMIPRRRRTPFAEDADDEPNDPAAPATLNLAAVAVTRAISGNPTTSNPTTSNPMTSNPMTSNPMTSNPMTSNPMTSNPIQPDRT